MNSTVSGAYRNDNNLVRLRQRHSRYGSCALAIVVAAVLLAAAGCSFNFGSPTRLADAPAPTSVPLSDTGPSADFPNPAPPDEPIRLPPGFQISVYARGLEEPRMMALGPDGQVYVAERGAGRIVRLPDRDRDGLADGVEVAAQGLRNPNSLAFQPDGTLYVGEIDNVRRAPAPDGQGLYQDFEVVVDGPAAGMVHRTRTVALNPDGSELYVAAGAPCNACLSDDERYAAVWRYNPDGSGGVPFATGLRNAVGLALRPGTDELWATNNGRDFLGDDLPPDTVIRLEQGDDHGFPLCHAGRIVDPDEGAAGACDGVEIPEVELQAHSAPLGLAFYSGAAFPAEYRGDLFVALHGSWNRSQPVGYKVVRIPIVGDRAGPVQDFAVGWLREDGSNWGRPMDVLAAADGSLLVSDDRQGFIYRIAYIGE
jgi:glucose/arabinose dehydrogenase